MVKTLNINKSNKRKDSVETMLGSRTAASALWCSNIFTLSCHEIRCGLEDGGQKKKKNQGNIKGKNREIPHEWRF